MTDHPFHRPPRRSRAEVIAHTMIDCFVAGRVEDHLATEDVILLQEIARSQFGQGKKFATEVAAAIGSTAIQWNADLEG